MEDINNHSQNSTLDKLLESTENGVKEFAMKQLDRVQRLTQIGIALSVEKDVNKLLEMILDEAMRFTNADAGTLYTMDDSENCLRFEIVKNLSMNTHMGGTSGLEIDWPPVSLEADGAPNFANVSSRAALTGDVVRITDVYETTEYDFSGPKKYDQQTGYRTKSMLVVPMKNHQNDVIGVLQLLNATDSQKNEVIPFAEEDKDMIASLASQAAVALENAQLIRDLQALFEAFIQSIATAIDEKSKYTAGHIRRVTELTMMIAETINESDSGLYKDINFSTGELEELRIAAWMHDIGKIVTPEYVVDKSHKLETIFDRIELVKTRFEMIKQLKTTEFLNQKVKMLQNGGIKSENFRELEAQHKAELTLLDNEMKFVVQCNTASEFMDDERLERLRQIGQKTYTIDGQEYEYLTEDECYNLSIRRGTLNFEERKIIENHAMVSIKMLRQLPFPKKFAHVPDYAGGHHEKLDGSGYPFGLTADQLALQSKILAIADIFEALTAKDRPYKSPMKLSQAVGILKKMCDQNHIDHDLYRLFIESGVYKKYAEKELNPEQVDVIEAEA